MTNLHPAIRSEQNAIRRQTKLCDRRIAPCSLLLGAILFLPAVGNAAMQEHSAGSDIAHGIQLMRDGKYLEAKAEFTAAIKIDPQSADALTWRGICENQLNQYRDAMQDLRSALRLDPNAQPAHYNLALSFIRVGQDDEAIRELQTVVQAHPDAVDAQYDLAVLLESRNALVEAIQHLKPAYDAQPNDPRIMQHLLIDSLTLGRSTDAQAILQRFNASNASPQAQLQLGAALLGRGYFRIAAGLIVAARSRLPAERKNDLLLARAYIGSSDDFKAIDLLKDAEHQDGSGESAYLLGLAYSGAGETQEAVEAFQTASNIVPKDAKPLFHLGMLYATMPEQQAEALHALREAIRLDPQNASYAIALAKILLQRDNAQDARGVLEHAHATGVEEAERDLLLGIAQVTTNGVAVAITTLQRAIELNPSLALSHNVLGFCYFKQGDYLRAAQSYQHASDLRPDILIFAYDTALAYERANQTTQAMSYAQRAVSLPAARSDDHYLLGKLYAQTGRRDDAVRELTLAISINPDLDESYYLLARTYMQMGKTAEASAWSDKLAALKQKHDQAYTQQKNAQSNAVSSSTLLQGAPMASEQDEEPR